MPNVTTSPQQRIYSIDIFRALTMFVMIFVNDIASVSNLPYWTYHMKAGLNGFTYVDMVFPVFLFIVGLSIPIAIRHRQAKGATGTSILKHSLLRVASLVFVGVLLLNGKAVNEQATGISSMLWNTLAFLAIFAVWNSYPQKLSFRGLPIKYLRWLGIAVLALLVLTFRRVDETKNIIWLRPEWWGILGLIGWAYLDACIYYLLFKNRIWALISVFILLIGVSVLIQEDVFAMPRWLDPFINCVLGPVTLAGVIVSLLVINNHAMSPWKKITRAALFSGALFIGGVALSPYGINGGNPSWTLFSASIATTLFIILFIIADLYRTFRWANFIKPFGNNTLLAYLLPDLFYVLFTTSYFSGAYFNEGLPGATRALCFTLLILGLTWLLTQLKIRLQL